MVSRLLAVLCLLGAALASHLDSLSIRLSVDASHIVRVVPSEECFYFKSQDASLLSLKALPSDCSGGEEGMEIGTAFVATALQNTSGHTFVQVFPSDVSGELCVCSSCW